ncbi:MAG: hypothetical protein Q4D56_04515 [Bacteroides sp.]|nr:hypothetical protein [Bacteroides sp.]
MKRLAFFITALLLTTGMAQAQYCATQPGTQLNYSRYQPKSKKTLSQVSYITKAEMRDGILTVEQRNRMLGAAASATDTLEFVRFEYDGKGTTNLIEMSEETMEQLFVQTTEATANDMKEAKSKGLSFQGSIVIPLKEDAKEGETFSDCTLVYKVGSMKFTTKLSEGKYEGYETIRTPAGEFRCLRVSYKATLKVSFVSDTSLITEWYAPGVGLVKSLEKTTKGKLVEEITLTSITTKQ